MARYVKGAKGTEINRIQTRLKELGLYTAAIDGTFGAVTEAAVRSFQKERKLAADGVVGPQTWNLLFSRFRFDNYARHVGKRGGHDWFEWKVFMDEPPETLAKVKSVEYRLHETFPDPIRIVEDRASRFAIESSGWGEFWIFITVCPQDGTEENTQYQLDLGKAWPSDAR